MSQIARYTPAFILTLIVLLNGHSTSASSAANDTVWIDVRTKLEHKLDHIDGDILIPHKNIVDAVKKKFPNKATKINLYCRVGGRAEVATKALRAAGYTQVSNIGSIDNARKIRKLESSEKD